MLLSESDIFCDVIDNALLHLYLTTTETSRFTPIPKRNDILVRYLKRLFKDNVYRSARKEIRSLLSLGKKSGINIEAKLIELHELSRRYSRYESDARLLFDVLTQLESEFGLSSRFINYLDAKQSQSNIIYLLQEDIEEGFIETGKQVAAVSLFLEFKKVDSVVKFINDGGAFQAIIRHRTPDAIQGHVVLHQHDAPLEV